VPSKRPRARPPTPETNFTPPEEIRARRIRRFVLLGALVACALGVASYFAARPIGGAIKGWQSRRLAREAFALIERQKWSEANAKARDAYLLRPTEPESWRAIARVASRTNQWPPALEWWKKVDDADRLKVEDRRDYIAAALGVGEVTLAAKQAQVLMAQHAPAAIDLVWAGQVAARQNDRVLAVDYAERALADKRAKPYDILSAATLVLSATTRDSQPYANAWKQVENVARDVKNLASLDALAVLAREQDRAPMLPVAISPSLSLEATPQPTAAPQGSAATSPQPEVSLASTPEPIVSTQSSETLPLKLNAPPQPASGGAAISAIEVAEALEKHPAAGPYHKLLALELRARHDPVLADQYVADAVERFRNGDDETLVTLAVWLNSIGRFAKTLEVLPEARALQRQDLFLQHVSALTALQRWNEIKDLLSSEHSVVDPVLQHMYLGVAQAHLGSATAATNEWQRALQSANTREKLLALASYAEQNSANDIADAAYSQVINIDPKDRTAYAGRLRIALAAGQTAQAQAIAAEIAQLWPDDAAARNTDAYLRVLLGAPAAEVEAAERDAEVLVASDPSNWPARATLGLSRLRLGRNNDALAVFRNVLVTGDEPPGVLAVRAAILAETGYEEGARQEARIIGWKPMLPEERALIAPLITVGD
jgi:tetratricopeptide (TPR) repeat protein